MNDQLLRTFYLELKAYHDRYEKAVKYLREDVFEPFKPMNVTLLFGRLLDNQINKREFLKLYIELEEKRYAVSKEMTKDNVDDLQIWEVFNVTELSYMLFQVVFDFSQEQAVRMDNSINYYICEGIWTLDELLDNYIKE